VSCCGERAEIKFDDKATAQQGKDPGK